MQNKIMKPDPDVERETPVPEDLEIALSADPAIHKAWLGLTAIGRRDYIGWIGTAKQADTRRRRIERCCESLHEGKRRPCCYAVVPMDLYKALGNTPDAKANWSVLDANEKRDFSDWVEDSADRGERKSRVSRSIEILIAGHRKPE